MLKKLRLKFILFNMMIVMIMLSLIFGLLYFSSSRNLEIDSIRMMNAIAMNPVHAAPPEKQNDNVRLPYFSILLSSTGEIIKTDDSNFDLSDDELLHQIIDKAAAMNEKIGVLDDYNLRFLNKETPMGRCFVFADISSEQSILNNLIKTFLLAGAAAFLIFLGISILLAKWSVSPVEKAWEQQKQFVADASHELKTPLTVILTDAELLNSPECSNTERVQLSGSILTMSRQMRGLIEGLLNLARIDGTALEYSKAPVSFSEIIEDCAMIFEPVFFEKGMPFSYDIESDIVINANSVQMKQLAEILLENAIKYAVPGGKTIFTLRQSSSKKCLLKISNQGDPIPEEDIDNLFKRFYRADKSRTGRQGYGLGLSIAESIVEKHRGKIWAESCNGYNIFFVELPKK